MGTATGCAVDEANASIYIAIQSQGLNRGTLDRSGVPQFVTVIPTSNGNGSLNGAISGVDVYTAARGGYLLVGSAGVQGQATFSLFDRSTLGSISSFVVGANDAGIPPVLTSANLRVTDVALGSAYPTGLFLAHSGTNAGTNPNFRLVAWGDVGRVLGAQVDTSVDVRALDASDAGSTATGDGGGGPISHPVLPPPGGGGAVSTKASGCSAPGAAGSTAVLLPLVLGAVLRRRGDFRRRPRA